MGRRCSFCDDRGLDAAGMNDGYSFSVGELDLRLVIVIP